MTRLEIILLLVVLVLVGGFVFSRLLGALRTFADEKLLQLRTALFDHATALNQSSSLLREVVMSFNKSTEQLVAAAEQISRDMESLRETVDQSRDWHERMLKTMTQEFAGTYRESYERGQAELKEALARVDSSSQNLLVAVNELPKYEDGLVKIIDKLIQAIGTVNNSVKSFERALFAEPAKQEKSSRKDDFIPYDEMSNYLAAEKAELIRNGMTPSEAEEALREQNQQANRYIEEAMESSSDSMTLT